MKIVLLPGMDGTGRLFAPFTEILPSTVETNIVTLIQKIGISYKEQAKYVSEKIDNNSIVVAESYSGMVALELAADFPEKVGQLIFVASFIAPPSKLSKLANLIPKQITKILLKPNWIQSKLLFGKYSSARLESLLKETMRDIQTDLIKFRLSQIAQISVIPMHLNTPALYLRAKEDWLVSNRACSYFNHIFVNLKIQSLKGTHFLMQTNPLGCWEEIQRCVIYQGTKEGHIHGAA